MGHRFEPGRLAGHPIRSRLDDLKKVAVSVGADGVPILLGQVANVQVGPDMRRGIAEWNGEGETVGGIVVVRYGANARQVIQDVKRLLDQAMQGLPPDVTYSVAYDRSALIQRAVRTLEEKLLEESLVVALVCLLFLLHFRGALVAILILPIAVLISFMIMLGAMNFPLSSTFQQDSSIIDFLG